jgi:hypothetical protein
MLVKQNKKTVSKNDEVEHDLRKSVKETEVERRKKEQEVQRLEEELIVKKREDAARIRIEIARAEHDEKQLEQQLIQERSKLDQVRAHMPLFCDEIYFLSNDSFVVTHTT